MTAEEGPRRSSLCRPRAARRFGCGARRRWPRRAPSAGGRWPRRSARAASGRPARSTAGCTTAIRSAALQAAGLAGVAFKTATDSDIPGFAGYELDSVAGRVRKPGSLFAEARRP
jgi:hypothetical protein